MRESTPQGLREVVVSGGGRGLVNGSSARAMLAQRRAGGGRTNGGGLTNGSGRTNGSGLTNGSGRTNGTGLTNGSGRTNGGGLTNGSGRVNGHGLKAGIMRTATGAANRRRSRRVAAAGVAALLLSLTAFALLGMASEASNAARVDGRFGEWDGREVQAPAPNGAGLAAFAFQPLKTGEEVLLEFGAPLFAGRQDVWLFVDEDASAATGWWTGDVGAERAVRVSGDDGRVMSAGVYAFSGGDRFDFARMVPSGAAQAAADGQRLEFTAPVSPATFAVVLTDPHAAVSSGAISATGSELSFTPPTAPLSGAVRNGIRIDGDFADWANVPRVEDPVDPGLPAHLDMLGAAAVGDDATAEFYLDTRGGALEGALPLRAEPLGGGSSALSAPPPPRRVAGTDLLEIYLDTDLSGVTGSRVGAIGAEYLLRVEGVSGKAVATDLFAWSAGGWTRLTAMAEAAASGHELEVAVDARGLAGARAVFVLTGFEGGSDTNDQPIVVGRQAGAFGAEPTAAMIPPSGRGEIPRNPIPEFSDAAAVAGAAALLTLVVARRRRRAPAAHE